MLYTIKGFAQSEQDLFILSGHGSPEFTSRREREIKRSEKTTLGFLSDPARIGAKSICLTFLD